MTNIIKFSLTYSRTTSCFHYFIGCILISCFQCILHFEVRHVLEIGPYQRAVLITISLLKADRKPTEAAIDGVL